MSSGLSGVALMRAPKGAQRVLDGGGEGRRRRQRSALADAL